MAKSRKNEKSFLTKTAWRLFGAFLITFCLAVIVSSFFYDANDSSFDVASSKPINNLLGSFGARSSGFVMSCFGLALPLFLIIPIIWGYNFIRLREFINYVSRTCAFILGTIFFSIFLALLPRYFGSFELGGFIGQYCAKNLMRFISSIYRYAYGAYLLAGIMFVLAWLGFNYAAGITYKNWFGFIALFVKFVTKAGVKFAGMFIALVKLVFGARITKTLDEPKIKIKKVREKKEPVIRQEPKLKDESKPVEKMVMNIQKIDDGYQYPDINLISRPEKKTTAAISEKELDKIARELENVLQEFGVNGQIVKVRPGPVVTLYELEPSPGTKTARVIGLADDIARSMSVASVRIAVVSGSNTIGIEMPNTTRETVWLRDLFEDDNFKVSKNDLNIVLGKDIGGRNVYADLAKMPHLLVAGTTGSGKSVGVNSMILSLLFRMRPDECKFIMIDPKMLEFSMYNGIPHLLTPVITDPSKAVIGLKWAVKEMEDRYRAMAQMNVRNISGYNQKLAELRNSGKNVKRTVQIGFDAETGKPIFEEQNLDLTPLPYIVIVVDEMADLMLVAGKDVEAAIQRLAQMARAAGLHLIMSTQRPSVDVITGTIKANFPTRISFQVTSKIDSRTILGEQGAEQLLGRGDMLYMPAGQRPIRIHGSFVKDSEVENIVDFIKSQKSPEYIEEVTKGELNDKASGSVFDKGEFGGGGGDDDLYNQAIEIVRNDKKASTSYIQRKLRIGYNRAASIVDRMETEGVVSAADHVGRREVL